MTDSHPDQTPASGNGKALKLADILPDMTYMLSVFDSMEIAEDEINKAKVRHPDRADAVHRAFRYLVPSDQRLMRSEILYRAHCAELLDRVAADEDLKAGTDAECILGLSLASLNAPIGQDATALYMRLLAKLDPAFVEGIVSDVGYEFRGRYPGSVEELEREIRGKLTHDRDVMEGSSNG